MEKIICDGCNVNEPHEHRCHGKERIMLKGREVHLPCECPACSKTPTSASLLKWAEAGHPDNFTFEYES